jgi:hypothetical protein
MVDFPGVGVYEPRWPGVKELNLADQWRARWVSEQELPENAPVHYLYALLLMGDKGYAVRESGGNRWGMIEGLAGDLTADAWLKQALKEQAGATLGRAELVGFLECKPTRFNTEFSKDQLTVRPLYVVAAKSVADVPEGSRFERRRFPLNEYVVAMRARYPELLDQLTQAFSHYAVMQAKAQSR